MLGMKRTKTDAGQTIGMWAAKGVEPENGGFYLVLPLAGPSNARDATGLMIDYASIRSRSCRRPQRRLVLLFSAALCDDL